MPPSGKPYGPAASAPSGKDSPLEETKARIVWAGVRIEKKQAVQALAAARTQLALRWGSKLPRFEKAIGNLEEVQPIPPKGELIRFLLDHPDLMRWEPMITRRQAELDAAKTKRIPDLTAQGGVQYFKEDDETAFLLGLSLPLPLSDRNQGGILAARHRIGKARAEQRVAELNVYDTLAEVYRSLSNAYIEVTDLTKDVLPGARDAFNATRQAYRKGKVDYLKVLDSQRTLFAARSRYIQALSAYRKSQADLEGLIGQRMNTISNTEN